MDPSLPQAILGHRPKAYRRCLLLATSLYITFLITFVVPGSGKNYLRTNGYFQCYDGFEGWDIVRSWSEMLEEDPWPAFSRWRSSVGLRRDGDRF
jgi:hypothetical protein